MIATHTQQVSTNLSTVGKDADKDLVLSKVKPLNTREPLFLPNRIITHHPKAGLNPLADAAGYLFTIIGKLKNIRSHRQLAKLQKELIQEMNHFQDSVKSAGYNAEYIIVCRYVLCSAIDDIIGNTAWGGQGQWESYSLLATFNQDTQYQDKFFTIMERAIKEPELYIDLMELIYICLSMGYKGQYRATEHSQYQLDQIVNTLYKHIQVYRGSFTKVLSPIPQKTPRPKKKKRTQYYLSYLYIFLVTTCVIMTIFVSLGYLMDVISNEAYKNLSPIQTSVLNPNPK